MLESFGSTSGSFIERVNSEVMQYKAHVHEGTGLFYTKGQKELSAQLEELEDSYLEA